MADTFDLSTIRQGFSDQTNASQAVFRRSLEALSRPGMVLEIESDAAPPRGVGAAACALLLTLLDQDTPLWVAPAIGPDAAAYFRFHTGCTLAASAGAAEFALSGSVAHLPPLRDFSSGSDDYPDRSATLVIEVAEISTDRGWHISGPGIRGEARLWIPQIDAAFVAQWAAMRAIFPRGVDIYFTCGSAMCCLSRTTQISGG